MSEAGRSVRQALALAALSVVVAVAVHLSFVKRFARGEFRTSFFQAAEYPGIRFITLAEAEDLWRAGQAAVLDARAEGLFERGHVPGARNIPAAGAGRPLPADLLGAARNGTLVVYCEGGDCLSSLTLAKRLHDEGFSDIRVLGGGWEEWTKAGLPEERAEERKGGAGRHGQA